MWPRPGTRQSLEVAAWVLVLSPGGLSKPLATLMSATTNHAGAVGPARCAQGPNHTGAQVVGGTGLPRRWADLAVRTRWASRTNLTRNRLVCGSSRGMPPAPGPGE